MSSIISCRMTSSEQNCFHCDCPVLVSCLGHPVMPSVSVIKTPLFVLAVRWVTTSQGGRVDVSWKQIRFAVRVSESLYYFHCCHSGSDSSARAQGAKWHHCSLCLVVVLLFFYLFVTAEPVTQNPIHDVIYIKNVPWRQTFLDIGSTVLTQIKQ